MTPEAATQALVAWATSVLPELQGAYDHSPDMKPEALPDLVVEVQRSETTLDGAQRFADRRLQQRLIEAHDFALSIMVNNDDPQVAAAQLRDFGHRLAVAWRSSQTLGGRVPIRDPFCQIDYTTPFVEYEDGTKGRELTMLVAVGDLVEAD